MMTSYTRDGKLSPPKVVTSLVYQEPCTRKTPNDLRVHECVLHLQPEVECEKFQQVV